MCDQTREFRAEWCLLRVLTLPLVLCLIGSVDGGWGPWSDWSGCSSSCGNGQRFRVRSCNNLPTANGGAPCRGRHMEIVSCNKGDCPT